MDSSYQSANSCTSSSPLEVSSSQQMMPSESEIEPRASEEEMDDDDEISSSPESRMAAVPVVEAV